MIEYIRQGIEYYNALTKANPWMVALLLPVVSAVIYALRSTPIRIWRFIKRHTTTTLQFNNAGYSGNESQFNGFMLWYMESPWAKFSRSIYLGGRDRWSGCGVDGPVIGPGLGKHFFFWRGRLFWFEKSGLESSGSERQKEAIELHTFGRKHQPILELIDQFKWEEPENSIGIYNLTKNGWERMANIVRRPLSSVCIDPEIKDHLVGKIDRFVNEKEWFASKGLPHKLTVLLYGIPGSGKTSLVQAIASHYKRNIMVMDLSVLTNSGLQMAIAALPKGSLLLLEDIDASTAAVNTRSVAPTQVKSSVEELKPSSGEMTPVARGESSDNDTKYGTPIQGFGLNRDDDSGWGLTLSGLLNALQGVIALDDVMVMMSTNHPEKLDPALIRSSRVDCRYEIGAMKSAQIHEYIRNMYPEASVSPDIVFNTTVGSDVQTAFLEHPRDVQRFMAMIGYESDNVHTLHPTASYQ